MTAMFTVRNIKGVIKTILNHPINGEQKHVEILFYFLIKHSKNFDQRTDKFTFVITFTFLSDIHV